jgi:tetratricopeptide (TPR) repeat protein
VQNASETSGQDLPDTLHGLVLARMDRLDRKDREAVQAASVLGQRFSLDALHHILGTTSYECAGLLQHRIVRPEGPDYLFAHALLREGVYSSLLQARRQGLHSRAAAFFAGQDAVLHAEHLDRAASPDAPQAYLAAAQEEADQVRYENALRLVARALDLEPEAASFALQHLQGELLRSLGSIPESIDAYRKALDVAQGESERCRALIGVAEGLRLKDEHSGLLETIDQAKAGAEAHGLMSEMARILQLRGAVHFIRGEIDACLQVNTASLETCPRCRISGTGGASFGWSGRSGVCQRPYDFCLQVLRQMYRVGPQSRIFAGRCSQSLDEGTDPRIHERSRCGDGRLP